MDGRRLTHGINVVLHCGEVKVCCVDGRLSGRRANTEYVCAEIDTADRSLFRSDLWVPGTQYGGNRNRNMARVLGGRGVLTRAALGEGGKYYPSPVLSR